MRRRSPWMTAAAVVLTGALAGAQGAPEVKLPSSPAGQSAVQVGGSWQTAQDGTRRYRDGKWLVVDYGRPLLRGRAGIFGSGAEYGAQVKDGAPVWRAGANHTTRLTTQAPLRIGTGTIQPGTYNVFVDLKPGAWTFILNTQPVQVKYDPNDKVNLFGAYNYDAKSDILRAPMTVKTTDASVEQFTIGFTNVTDTRATLTMAWDTTLASIDLTLASAAPQAAAAGAADGSITFPTSGAPAAQPAFLTGVKALHNFQFDEAAEAFRAAQQADSGFVMAFWGEAMSHNHPLWAQQDVPAAKAVLDRLAPTAEARVARAATPKERAYVEALHTLYFSPGDKLTRDRAYADAMARMHAQWPDDHEVTVFYALSLLGTMRPGESGYRRQALAASLARQVFTANPNHPGAAHFIIHAFDDPDHAVLALDAARAYARIAPAAAHALHMPSHIFVQLGMWEDAATSNIDAYKAAVAVNARMKLAEGREDFHTLSWLAYANTMMGKLDEAAKNVEQARQAAERNPNSAGIRNGYLAMRARLMSDSARWEPLTLQSPMGGEAHAGMPGMAGMATASGADSWTWAVGMSAARRGDLATADAAEKVLTAAREKAAAGGNAYAVKVPTIREKTLAAVIRWARGQKDAALQLAREASETELTTDAPSGPPEPIKPAPELYGELLLEAGRAGEAAAAFESQLLRTPNRTPSVKGLASARAAARPTTSAR